MLERLLHLGGTKDMQRLPVPAYVGEMRYPVPPPPIRFDKPTDPVTASFQLQVDHYRKMKFRDGQWAATAMVHDSLDDSAAVRAIFCTREFSV